MIMRSETRTRTISETVYIANDGAEFKNYNDCHAHEVDLFNKKKELIDYRRIRKLDSWYPYVDYANPDTMDYFWYDIKTEEELKLFNETFNFINGLKDIKLPEIICVEINEDCECYWYTLSSMKETLNRLFNIVGYEIVKKGD